MKVFGIDVTSRPRRAKPITCLACTLTHPRLRAVKLTEWTDFVGFEAALRRPGPWIAGKASQMWSTWLRISPVSIFLAFAHLGSLSGLGSRGQWAAGWAALSV
jgi:hypothetical protein